MLNFNRPFLIFLKRGLFLAFLISLRLQAAVSPLQDLIENANTGETLNLPAGTYKGQLIISKGITLDGQNKTIIDGEGQNSVVIIDTDGAQVRNLHITNSGSSHNNTDACIQIKGHFNIVKDNLLDNCLIGIDLQQSNHNVVRRNKISSKPLDLGLRGDAIRLWYSNDNKVTQNDIKDARDTVVWYSKDNLISENKTTRSRYALHFMYSQTNKVEKNQYINNSVGIFLMYSDGVEIRDNYIAHATGATGVGIGFKETGNVVVENNQILYCASGIYLDLSPFQPETINDIKNNQIAYNGTGILFHNDWTGNVFKENYFKGNISQVAVNGARTANRNTWEGNIWDDYTGFDQNKDGIGDTPYQLYSYADQLLTDLPFTKFFKGTPLLELLNFLDQLAPFNQPILLLEDKRPLLKNRIKK
jgi:nitrous oxidase accessory protein